MRTIIAGGRDFNDFWFMCYMLEDLDITSVVSGHATKGADILGERWSREILNLKPTLYPANWNKYGRWQAGFIRNEQMAVESGAEQCIVFWDLITTGSGDMIKRARAHKLKLIIIEY